MEYKKDERSAASGVTSGAASRVISDDVMIKELIAEGLRSRESAYAPYSGFKVGAAVLGDDGKIYGGFNIENASYGATNCAERTAIFTALNMGVKRIHALAVTGDPNDFTFPCGICRQVMTEFADGDMPVFIVKNKEEYMVMTLSELLPGAFTGKDLEKGEGEKE